jgi:hypothetical protein
MSIHRQAPNWRFINFIWSFIHRYKVIDLIEPYQKGVNWIVLVQVLENIDSRVD